MSDKQVTTVETPQTEGFITEVTELDLMSAACELFIQGKSAGQMYKILNEKYGKFWRINRETPYKLLTKAGEKGFLHYAPPPDLLFERRISNHFMWLNRVNVVKTIVPLDVARETAQMLESLVQEQHARNEERNEVHIGFAAGLSMREVARFFAQRLTYPRPNMPEKIVFHAMLSGYDPGDPTTDPNNFFTFYINPPTLQFKTEFVGFRAPAIVKTESIPAYTDLNEINNAFKRANDLDIIVTSGADWNDPHSSLRKSMERSSSTMETLKDAGIVCDMLWRPLGPKAPITTATKFRALTVVELDDLPTFISKGKHVLLMLGPCSQCDRHKGPVLQTILGQTQHLVTHVVADSRSAGYVVNGIDRGVV
jgi:DNA-binding transcriptional regulator LsrR (DeoR family)